MSRAVWELDDPQATITQIGLICPLRLGRSIIAAIRLDDQVVTAAEVALDEEVGFPAHHLDGSDIARRIAERIVPERGPIDSRNGGMSHSLVTLVCRDGFVIPGRREFAWLLAWRYSNHLRGAFNGDVYVVTPHGWTGVGDERAGYEPHIASEPPPDVR